MPTNLHKMIACFAGACTHSNAYDELSGSGAEGAYNADRFQIRMQEA